VDAAALLRGSRRARRLLYTAPAEAPRAGQLSGAAPALLAEAARLVAELGFDIVDLNFECPVRRLLCRGEGGALMADPPAIGRAVAAVVHAVPVPVTLKIRSGPDSGRETAVEVARRAEQAGAAAVSVHGRSVAQGYVGPPDWDVIRRVKEAVRIPVLGSGGIRQPEDAVQRLRHSGADGVAIARGCLGNPWIFQQCRALLSGGVVPRLPSGRQRGQVLLRLVEGEFRLYGPTVALRRLPRTSGYFSRFLPDRAAFRQALANISSLDQFRRLVTRHFR
jgi:tRNA-dihydrouridine synthase B